MTDELNVNLSNARDLRKAERAHYKSRITDLESQYQLLQSKIEEFEELKETLLAKFGESAPTPTPEVPTFTPLPPILPSDNSNFQKVVQFPHYCCSCTFKSKILIDRTESSSSTNSDETVDDRNKQQNMDLTPEEMIIYEYLLEVMK